MIDRELPQGWTVGDLVPHEEIYSDPPDSLDPLRINLYGMVDGDIGHRIYSILVETPIADLVRFFGIGSHGAASFGLDRDAVMELVISKAIRIYEMIPSRVIFADSAGLKLKFLRPIEDKELDLLVELFPEDEAAESGALGYLIEQEPDRHFFQRVKDENLFHFWWD